MNKTTIGILASLVAFTILTFASASHTDYTFIRDKGPITIPYADTDLIKCNAAWGETCPNYTGYKDTVLRYDENNYLDEIMRGRIEIRRGKDYIKVEFSAYPWGNDALVSKCGTVKVTEKIGKKVKVYKDTKDLCDGTKSTGETYANFRYAFWGGECFNFGVLDSGKYEGFCI